MKEASHEVDVHIGRQIRTKRNEQGLSQANLAAELGVTFQTIQKYERGSVRVSASTLWALARSLKAQPGDFFEGLS